MSSLIIASALLLLPCGGDAASIRSAQQMRRMLPQLPPAASTIRAPPRVSDQTPICRRSTPPRCQLDDGNEDEAFLDELRDDLARASSQRPPLRARRRAPRRSGAGGAEDDEDPNAVFELTRSFLDELLDAYGKYSEQPSSQLLLGSLSLLVGFWVAHGLTPGIVGQGGYWEYVAGGVAIFVVERISRAYWLRPPAARSPTLQLLHSFKVGFVFGAVLDALKLGG